MSKLRMSVSYSDSYGEVSFKVMDADDKVFEQQVYAVTDLPDTGDVAAHVNAYGLNKVLTDRTSDIKDKREKLAAMDAVFEQLCEGTWAKERVVGAIVVSCEVEALAFIMKLSVPEAQAALAAYPKEQRGKILANEEVVRGAAAIREGRKDAVPTSLDDFIS